MISNDEHTGLGGSYMFNPVTGKRELIDGSRTEQSVPQAPEAEAGVEVEVVKPAELAPKLIKPALTEYKEVSNAS